LILAGVVALAGSLVVSGAAYGHGYTTNPPSRSYRCSTGEVTGCGAIQYEPQSVEGPKGFPQAGPADGQICAAGNSNWAPLDDPRGGGWPAEKVTGGQGYTFAWHFTAIHATTSFRFFVTNSGYDPTKPLTRAALNLTPFLDDELGGQRPSGDWSQQGTMPTGLHGRHLILGVWDIADTGNAFYSCADVDFG
jgi:chitin-binding protein